MHDEPTHLDLFSGIGGFALAAGWAGFRTIAFSEINPYAIAVLRKHWPDVPNLGDVRRFADWPDLGNVSLLTGGFPCQPHSLAGKRRGSADDRHLWPAMRNVIGRYRPAWVCGENVPGIIGMELDRVLSDLEGIGYRVQPLVVPACAVDAPHRRERVWIVANTVCPRGRENPRGTHGDETTDEGWTTEHSHVIAGSSKALADTQSQQASRKGQGRLQPQPTQCGAVLANCISKGLEGRQEQPAWQECEAIERSSDAVSDTTSMRRLADSCRWPTEPDVGRVAHGVSRRVDRLKGLGNAIVPQVAYQILKAIREQL